MRALLIVVGTLLSQASGASDAFAPYLQTQPGLASGFVRADLQGERITAPARGRVIDLHGFSHGFTVLLEHRHLENHRIETTRSRIWGLESVEVKVGDLLEQGDVIGQGAATELHFGPKLEAERVPSPAERVASERFLADHRRLLVPREEATLVLIDTTSHRLRLYRAGREVEALQVGFGQAAGAKEGRGDNRTPAGTYFIVDKHRGEFSGPLGAYYGGHWLRLNYPNRWDAARGVARGWITEAQAERIAQEWADRRRTDEKTRLGGGIGFHGWIGDWRFEETRGRMSWGCIVLHNPDIARLFDALPVGTPVILF